MQRYVVILVSLFLLACGAAGGAYFRASQSDKFDGIPLKTSPLELDGVKQPDK